VSNIFSLAVPRGVRISRIPLTELFTARDIVSIGDQIFQLELDLICEPVLKLLDKGNEPCAQSTN
jgi:hypothetical protein